MKNNNLITLDKAKLNSTYYIKNIYGFEEKQLYRLFDFGLVKGCRIIPVLKSVISGTSAYSVKGSVLSLRDEDANNIVVSFLR